MLDCIPGVMFGYRFSKSKLVLDAWAKTKIFYSGTDGNVNEPDFVLVPLAGENRRSKTKNEAVYQGR